MPTLQPNTTNSNITVDSTTVASTTIEIATSTTTAAPPTTIAAPPENIALEEPSKKLPDTADRSNGNEEIQHENGEPISPALNTPPATEPPPSESPPVNDKVMQPLEGDNDGMAHAPAAEAIKPMPSAYPVDTPPAETPIAFEEAEK